ncbi:sarcocystatin-A [Drosophila guanche]|uniref:Blast:Sarcocystatin-A n=1 Tax=Drosophila guanche TaxID=7266 RepID=A0A3B0K7B0_DROGU|nr:sarcocystatin-A [Drosophila guanche]SPP88562.1 blast:Sarcocystatin-A [Drosophila guanche]
MFKHKFLLICLALALSGIGALVSGSPHGDGEVPPPAIGGLGAPRTLTVAELDRAHATLTSSLDTLAAGEGPSYRVSKIMSTTVQVVAGSLNSYIVELIEPNGATKVCEVRIWSRHWLPNGIQITFNCPNEPEVVKTLYARLRVRIE